MKSVFNAPYKKAHIFVIYLTKNNFDTKYPNNIFYKIIYNVKTSKHKSLFIQLTLNQN